MLNSEPIEMSLNLSTFLDCVFQGYGYLVKSIEHLLYDYIYICILMCMCIYIHIHLYVRVQCIFKYVHIHTTDTIDDNRTIVWR